MFKWISLVASVMTIALLVVQPATASVDLDGTPWAAEFTGDNNPTTQGWTQTGSNHHQYNSRLGDGNPVGGTPGWMIASGNPGNHWSRADAVNITHAGGWTFEFTAATHPGIPAGQNHQSEWLRLMDGQARISFGVHPSNGTVKLWDRYWNVPEDIQPIVLYDGSPTGLERTYRIRRLAGSPTVELYVDNDFSSPYAQITPTNVAGGAGALGIQVVGDSFLEGNVAGWRYRAGGVIPEPASLMLLGLGGLLVLRRRKF